MLGKNLIKKILSKAYGASTSNEIDVTSKKLDILNEKIEHQNREYKDTIAQLHHHIHLCLKSSDNITKLMPRKLQEKVKIVFLISNIDAWISICDVISLALQSEHFDVIICSIPKKFPGEKNYGGEEKVHDFLKRQNVKHIRLNMQDSWAALDILRALAPDVLFRQSQWDRDYDIGLRSDVLAFTRLAYISYEIINQTENVHFDDNVIDNATDSHWHRRCWRVYCANDLVKKRAAKKGRMNGKQFVVTGHPKVEYILRAKPCWPFEEKENRKKRLVWSAHHSIQKGWSDFGMFHLIWKYMLDWANNSPDTEFVFSPHPALLTLLESDNSPMKREDIDFFFSRWNRMENTSIFWGGDYSGIMAASDVLFSDSLSMPTEYQLRNKPIVFLDREDRIQFNEIGQIIEQGFHKFSKFDEAKHMAMKLLEGYQDPLSDIQEKNMKFLFSEPNSAERILKDIYNGIQGVSI